MQVREAAKPRWRPSYLLHSRPRLHLGRVAVRFLGDRLRYLVSRTGSVGASAIDRRRMFSSKGPI